MKSVPSFFLRALVFGTLFAGASAVLVPSVLAADLNAEDNEDIAPLRFADETEGVELEDLAMDMVQIPPGEFWLGTVSAMDNHEEDQAPATLVRIPDPFWMSATEVTQDAFEAVMDNNPSECVGGPELPVENVSWMAAMEFCERLTDTAREAARLPEGHVFRLPTEAEWEYAARAGSEGEVPSPLHHYVWYSENSGGRTQPVGVLKPNAWGLHDMLGNVFEWCLDWYGPYSGGFATNPPQTVIDGSHRVVRGGSWASPPERVHFAKRGGDEPDLEGTVLGFRVVLAPER